MPTLLHLNGLHQLNYVRQEKHREAGLDRVDAQVNRKPISLPDWLGQFGRDCLGVSLSSISSGLHRIETKAIGPDVITGEIDAVKQRALDPPDLAQCSSVLLAVGGQLLQNRSWRDGAVAHRDDDTFDIWPVTDDQVPVEPMTDSAVRTCRNALRLQKVEASSLFRNRTAIQPFERAVTSF